MFLWKEIRETFPLVLLSLVAMLAVSRIRWSEWRIEFFELQYWAVVILCLSFVVPIIGAGAIAGERETRTLEFLLSRPVSLTGVYFMKYLVRLAFLILMLAILLLIFSLIRPTHNLRLNDVFKGGVIFFAFLLYMLSASFLFSSITETPSKAFVSSLMFVLGTVFIVNATPFFRFAWLWRNSIDDLWLKYLCFYGALSCLALILGALLSSRNAMLDYEWKHIGVGAILLLLLFFNTVSTTFWLIPRIAGSGDMSLLRLARQPLDEILVEASSKEKRISGFLTYYLSSVGSGEIDRELIKGLKNPEPEVRNKAIELLIARKNKSASAAVIELLDDPDISVRHSAITYLEEFKSPGAVPKLESLLHDSNSSIRQNAVWSLAEIEGKDAAKELLPLLHDPNPRVVRATMYWLSTLDYQEAQPEIVKLLLEHPLYYIRESAAKSLRGMKSDPACDALIQALTDENYRVSASAAESLGILQCDDAVQPLLELVSATPAQQRSAIFALGRIRGLVAETTLKDLFSRPDLPPLIKQKAAFALAEMGDEQALEYLRAQLKMAGEKPNPSAREHAIRLCRIGDYAAIPFLISYLDQGHPTKRLSCGKVLTELTGKYYGWDARRWNNWWEKNKDDLMSPAKNKINGGE
jgi:HEAT repeat protein